MALLFVRALENEISKCKIESNSSVMISRVWGFYGAVCKIKNFSKLWINLVDEAFSASFVRFLSKFIVQDDHCLFYSSISYAQFTGTRMWCTELHFVTHVSHALVILFISLQMNWDDCTALKLVGMARLSKGLILYTGLKSKSGSN